MMQNLYCYSPFNAETNAYHYLDRHGNAEFAIETLSAKYNTPIVVTSAEEIVNDATTRLFGFNHFLGNINDLLAIGAGEIVHAAEVRRFNRTHPDVLTLEQELVQVMASILVSGFDVSTMPVTLPTPEKIVQLSNGIHRLYNYKFYKGIFGFVDFADIHEKAISHALTLDSKLNERKLRTTKRLLLLITKYYIYRGVALAARRWNAPEKPLPSLPLWDNSVEAVKRVMNDAPLGFSAVFYRDYLLTKRLRVRKGNRLRWQTVERVEIA